MCIALAGCSPPVRNEFVDRSALVENWRCDKQENQKADLANCPLHSATMSELIMGTFDSQELSAAEFRRLFNIYRLAIDLEFETFRNAQLHETRQVNATTTIFGRLLPLAGISGELNGSGLGATALAAQLINDAKSTTIGSHTTQVLVTRMAADRQASIARIKGKVEKSQAETEAKEYLPSELLFDMILYHRSGTYEHALQKLFNQAGQGSTEVSEE